MTSRMSASWRANASAIAPGALSHRTVLPSISENSNVTVPVGRAENPRSHRACVAIRLCFVLGRLPSAARADRRGPVLPLSNLLRMTTVAIPGTRRRQWPASTRVGDVRTENNVLLTAWLRPDPKNALDTNRAYEIGRASIGTRTYSERAALVEATAATESTFDELRSYCARYGIETLEQHWRCVVLRAPLDRSIEAFGASVAMFEDSGGYRFRHRTGSLHAPREIAALLHGVFGFHQWPRSQRLESLQRHETPLSAVETAERYRFPQATGRGQTIAILQFRGEFREDDFARCMQAQRVSVQQPHVKRLDDASLVHKVETVKDLEAALDVQIAAALAPDARVVLYQAPDDERGFLDALRAAIFDEEMRPSIISVSYGWPEPLWTPCALDILNDLFAAAALLGITVFCSSGDHGAELQLDGKPHAVAPASVPFAHAAGATQIQPGNTEIAWEHTGGGFSEYFESAPVAKSCTRSCRRAGCGPGTRRAGRCSTRIARVFGLSQRRGNSRRRNERSRSGVGCARCTAERTAFETNRLFRAAAL